MRFLVVSAFLACAAAAPSHLLAPVALPAPVVPVTGVAAVPVAYSALPTLSPGDVQAAAIDAQVKAQDLAIAAADKAREFNDLAAENLKKSSDVLQVKAIVATDAVKENAEEAFWAVQEKQWQALDAIKTAEAQLDGALASNAPVLAKNAVVGIAPISPFIAGVAPVSPIVYTPGVVAPAVKAIEAPKEEEAKPVEAKPEEVKAEEKNEALVKSAEDNTQKDSVAIEASTKNLEAKPQLAPIVAPLAIQPYYAQYQSLAPVAIARSPLVADIYRPYPQVSLVNPALVKTIW